jgi:hypothetical protein
MSADGGPPSAMQPFSGRRSSQPLTAADAERLLAGRGVHPEAPAVQHALAGLLASAAGPPSDQELAGEVATVAAVMLAIGQREHYAEGSTRRLPHFRPHFRAYARRGQAVAAGIAAAIVMAFSGAAAADVLPAPIQELAHTTFDAPAPPRHSAPAPKATLPSGQHGHRKPIPATSPSPSAQGQHGKAKAIGKKTSPKGAAHGVANGAAHGVANGAAHGVAKGRSSEAPGHQKP